MKKYISLIGLTFMLFVFGSFLIGCDKPNASYTFENTKELYAFSIVSGMELALNNNSSNTQLNQTQSEFNDIVNSVHSYLPTFENFLGNDKLIIPSESNSDNSSYSKMLTVNYNDNFGNNHNYKIYYNEYIPSQNNRPFDDNDDDEIETVLNGEVIYNNTTYTMSGKKEVEQGEFEISFEINIDVNKKIIIEQEHENNEQEFQYSLYNQNKLIYSNAFEFKFENGMIEFETEYESQNQNLELEIKQTEKNNHNLFNIEYEKNNKKIKIKVEKIEENNLIKYIYSNSNFTVTKEITK